MSSCSSPDVDPIIAASLERLSQMAQSASKVLEQATVSLPPLGTLVSLELPPGLFDSVNKVVGEAALSLPQLELPPGLFDSVNKVVGEAALSLPSLDTFLSPRETFLPLGLRPGALDCVDQVREEPSIAALSAIVSEQPLEVTVTPADNRAGLEPLDEALWVALSALPGGFQEMHQGAWFALLCAGPDSRRQSAHSARELIDSVLRALAPDMVFTPQDIAREGHEQRPTRAMRVKWIVGAHDGELAKRIAQQVRWVHSQLACVAHTGRGSMQYVRSLLRSAEAVLLALLAEAPR